MRITWDDTYRFAPPVTVQQPRSRRLSALTAVDLILCHLRLSPSSSRPGRPPKRCAGAGIQESPRLLHPGLPGLLSPNLLSHTGKTQTFIPSSTLFFLSLALFGLFNWGNTAGCCYIACLQKPRISKMSTFNGWRYRTLHFSGKSMGFTVGYQVTHTGAHI